jgi:hypothetical protein
MGWKSDCTVLRDKGFRALVALDFEKVDSFPGYSRFSKD